ncbi:hypothetical protein NITHO_2750015 [Nitrolancea hollandica Lb]|uniref:Uncharacterized protein n=1 Tax=Nitrolancea hollandica Lb TaxID=1129897 RepID=I4EGL7_9BACT|nr:hypothetical protein NITHO_2750015 [Nitrolancea hollandica Lb]
MPSLNSLCSTGNRAVQRAGNLVPCAGPYTIIVLRTAIVRSPGWLRVLRYGLFLQSIVRYSHLTRFSLI